MRYLTHTPPARLIQSLSGMSRMVCVGHVNPDADCLGSMLAIARAWSGNTNTETVIALRDDSLSSKLSFMTEWAGAKLATVEDFTSADGFTVLDTADLRRCNVPEGLPDDWAGSRPIVNIDHHISNTLFGDTKWVVENAASTSELVFSVIHEAGFPVDPITASLLYAGIYTDTVGFSVSSTSGDTLRIAGELVDLGARVGRLCEQIVRSQRPEEFLLTRLLYDNTRTTGDGRIAYSTASFEEIQGTGCGPGDIDNQVSIPRSMDGIRLAILFTEAVKGRTRINFRGEQGTQVLELARSFGGGGHGEAAGVTLACSVDDATKQVLPLAIEVMTTGSD